MGLPELNAKNKNALCLGDYYSYKLKAFLRMEEDTLDRKLTKYNLEAVRNFNEYLSNSRLLVYKMRILAMLIDDEYSKGNIYNNINSLSKQRKLAKSVKRKLKMQGIDKEWYKLMKYTIDSMAKRLSYLECYVVKVNIEMTELSIYMKELEKKGISFSEDIEEHFVNESVLRDSAFSENDDLFDKYIEYIKDTINRSTLTDEEKKEYLEKKRKQEEMKRKNDEMKATEKKEKKERLYKERCELLQKYAPSVQDSLIKAYKNVTIKLKRLQNALEEDSVAAMFICFKRGFGNDVRYLKQVDIINNIANLTMDICTAKFYLGDEIQITEQCLKDKFIPYAICYFDKEDVEDIIKEITTKNACYSLL